MAEESEAGYAEVVRSAGVPVNPVSPNAKLNLVLVALRAAGGNGARLPAGGVGHKDPHAGRPGGSGRSRAGHGAEHAGTA